MKEQTNELFFIQVKDSSEIRRNILEILKEIVQVLKRFERFKHIKDEKIENMHKLRGLLKDTNKMLGNLKLKMPKTNLRTSALIETPSHPTKVHHKKKKIGKTPEEKMPKKEMTQLEKLEKELGAIESKLKSLT